MAWVVIFDSIQLEIKTLDDEQLVRCSWMVMRFLRRKQA
jgi:hypothetical protein